MAVGDVTDALERLRLRDRWFLLLSFIKNIQHLRLVVMTPSQNSENNQASHRNLMFHVGV